MNGLPFYVDAICPIDPFRCCSLFREKGWEIFFRSNPNNPDAFTFLAIHIQAMGKLLSVDPNVYRSWCKKEIWPLALPESKKDFYLRLVPSIDPRIDSNLPAFARAYEKIMAAEEQAVVEFAPDCSIFRTDSNRTFATFGKQLGKGHAATVWKCIDLFNARICICNISRASHDSTLLAYAVCPSAQPKIYDAMVDGSKHILFQERFSCTVINFSDPAFAMFQNERNRASILAQLLAILVDLHRTGVHRDISDSNTLLLCNKNSHQITAKFCDYEFWTAHIDRKKIRGGNPYFTPPEYAKALFKDKNPEIWVQPCYDIFSLGIVACVLWGHENFIPWWDALPPLQCLSNYTKEHWMREPINKTSIDHLIWRMTHFDPKRRPTAQQALDFLLEHQKI